MYGGGYGGGYGSSYAGNRYGMGGMGMGGMGAMGGMHDQYSWLHSIQHFTTSLGYLTEVRNIFFNVCLYTYTLEMCGGHEHDSVLVGSRECFKIGGIRGAHTLPTSNALFRVVPQLLSFPFASFHPDLDLSRDLHNGDEFVAR